MNLHDDEKNANIEINPEIFLLGNFFPVQNNEAKNVQGKHGDSKSYNDWNKKLFCFGVLSFS